MNPAVLFLLLNEETRKQQPPDSPPPEWCLWLVILSPLLGFLLGYLL